MREQDTYTPNHALVLIGSAFTTYLARVVPHGVGFGVRCSCGGTIGINGGFGPFTFEDEAYAAAHLHIAGHCDDTREQAVAKALHPAGSNL